MKTALEFDQVYDHLAKLQSEVEAVEASSMKTSQEVDGE